MGYKSTLRSFGAIVRQSQRDSIRKHRALEKQRELYNKMQEIERIAFEVEEYENYIERMTTIHKECGETFDWNYIKTKQPPSNPVKKSINETNAQQKLHNFKPGFFDKLFKKVESKITKLQAKVEEAKKIDAEIFLKEQIEYKQALLSHEENVKLATGILSGDIEAYKIAVEDLDPVSEISEIGSQVVFNFISEKKIKAMLSVHDTKVIPKQIKSQLKSGKLSVKEMPQGRYNEIYQDYVCSASLRVAREIFALLPVDEVLVTAKGSLLNSATGKMEDQPILSVKFIRETIQNINFESIDPSDCMKNFINNMAFKKTSGFGAIEELV